jgi:flagellar biosynthesis/type III secretory pathway protein FliH
MSLSRPIPVASGLFRLVPGAKGGVAFVTPAPAAPRRQGPDLEAIRREAFAAGQAQARAELEALATGQRERARRLETGLEAYLDRLERHLNEQSLELGLRLAEVLLRHSLPDRDMLRTVMAEALEPVADARRVKVRLHPDDAAVFDGGNGLPPSLSGRLDLVPDPGLAPGDVVMENGFGLLDARISERLDLLRTRLKERFRESHADGRTA